MGHISNKIIQTVFLDNNLPNVQVYSQQLFKIERNLLQLYATLLERLGKLGCILKYYIAITIFIEDF